MPLFVYKQADISLLNTFLKTSMIAHMFKE